MRHDQALGEIRFGGTIVLHVLIFRPHPPPGRDVRFRHCRFKLIPSVREGPWLVKLAVNRRPLIVHHALTSTYVDTDRYLGVDVDVGSNKAASSTVRLVLGRAEHMASHLCHLHCNGLSEGRNLVVICELFPCPDRWLGTSDTSLRGVCSGGGSVMGC